MRTPALSGSRRIVMAYFRFSSSIIVFCIGLFLLGLLLSTVQVVPADDITADENVSEFEPAEPLTIKVYVNEASIDVVVLDKKGTSIMYLSAADFEVFQDDKRQDVLAAVFDDSQPDTASQTVAGRKDAPTLPLQLVPVLKKETDKKNSKKKEGSATQILGFTATEK